MPVSPLKIHTKKFGIEPGPQDECQAGNRLNYRTAPIHAHIII